MHQQPENPQEWPAPASGPEDPAHPTHQGPPASTGDALDETWFSLPPGVGAVPYRPPAQPAPAPSVPGQVRGPGPLPPAEPEPVPAPVRVSAPAPVPAPEPEREPDPEPAAPPEAAAPAGEPAHQPVPLLGTPPHSGPRPPLYPPDPGALPGVREDLDGAVLPDIVVDGARYGALTVRAASVRGDSHRYEGGPRQDALVVCRIGGPEPAQGLLLLAVADGVGSAARSHVGSHDVCRGIAFFLDRYADQLAEALRLVDERTLGALVNSAVGSVAEGLAQRAEQGGESPTGHATTLRGLLVPLDPTVRHRGFFAVGDGGAARLRRGAWEVDVFGEGHGGSGVIDTGTAALPGSRLARSEVFGPVEDGDVLVLCTDGLSTPLAGDPGMREFLAAAWGGGPVPGPVDFLWQLQYRVKSYDDDRTAVVLWEGPGA
ncbi:protein phosphatase 2C domain-containing protein [Streptomyces sp. LE64]|uniref:protein phosphatase 2C domain-containing protein n=1 Tax=Streptomyces sp. LE64 TaxID=3448653 RepID=UPI004041A494